MEAADPMPPTPRQVEDQVVLLQITYPLLRVAGATTIPRKSNKRFFQSAFHRWSTCCFVCASRLTAGLRQVQVAPRLRPVEAVHQAATALQELCILSDEFHKLLDSQAPALLRSVKGGQGQRATRKPGYLGISVHSSCRGKTKKW